MCVAAAGTGRRGRTGRGIPSRRACRPRCRRPGRHTSFMPPTVCAWRRPRSMRVQPGVATLLSGQHHAPALVCSRTPAGARPGSCLHVVHGPVPSGLRSGTLVGLRPFKVASTEPARRACCASALARRLHGPPCHSGGGLQPAVARAAVLAPGAGVGVAAVGLRAGRCCAKMSLHCGPADVEPRQRFAAMRPCGASSRSPPAGSSAPAVARRDWRSVCGWAPPRFRRLGPRWRTAGAGGAAARSAPARAC